MMLLTALTLGIPAMVALLTGVAALASGVRF